MGKGAMKYIRGISNVYIPEVSSTIWWFRVRGNMINNIEKQDKDGF